MTNQFKIGEVVLYQLRPNSEAHVRARITHAGTYFYSIQRLDPAASGQTHHVQESSLSPLPNIKKPTGETHHAAL